MSARSTRGSPGSDRTKEQSPIKNPQRSACASVRSGASNQTNSQLRCVTGSRRAARQKGPTRVGGKKRGRRGRRAPHVAVGGVRPQRGQGRQAELAGVAPELKGSLGAVRGDEREEDVPVAVAKHERRLRCRLPRPAARTRRGMRAGRGRRDPSGEGVARRLRMRTLINFETRPLREPPGPNLPPVGHPNPGRVKIHGADAVRASPSRVGCGAHPRTAPTHGTTERMLEID